MIAITEQSKKRTNQIIEQNIKKMDENLPTKDTDDVAFLTRLNKRGKLRTSCFPSLLGAEDSSPVDLTFRKKKHKADTFYKGTTYFMPEGKI